MAGHYPSSTSYAMTRALPSLSSSPRLPESLEDSLKRAGIIVVEFSRKMKLHSYFQWIDNRFTDLKTLKKQSFVFLVGALALEEAH